MKWPSGQWLARMICKWSVGCRAWAITHAVGTPRTPRVNGPPCCWRDRLPLSGPRVPMRCLALLWCVFMRVRHVWDLWIHIRLLNLLARQRLLP